MGSTKISTEQGGTSQATPTAEESELNKLLLERTRATQAGTMQAQQGGLSLINQLLAGQQPSGGLYDQLGGISAEAIGQQATQYAQKAMPRFNQQGLYDSGTMYKNISRGIANEVLFPAEQFNVGAKQNLLNLALSGQAQVQQPMQAQTGTLASQLAGLRTTTQTGYGTQVNPYQGANLGIFGTWGGNYCWVASEIFGGWDKPETCMVRYYIGNLAPKWFRNLYIKYGERIAKFIHNKSILKLVLKPLFKLFIRRVKCQFLLY